MVELTSMPAIVIVILIFYYISINLLFYISVDYGEDNKKKKREILLITVFFGIPFALLALLYILITGIIEVVKSFKK